MRGFGVERAFAFPFNDPERRPAYRLPNDRVLEWAAASEGALVPFCRLDMLEAPVDEATRCLDRGARGIKLHPRAQRFGFDEAALDPVMRLAAERHVPVLVHAGRGLPPIAADLVRLVERHPGAQLILAHAAIADLEHLSRLLTDHPNVHYDTSVWSSLDMRALLATASPEQVLYASDAPYGTYPVGQLQLVTLLRRAGADDDVIRAVLWGNAERVAAGRPAEQLSPPLMPGRLDLPLQRLRLHEYLVMAATLLWTQQPDTPGAIGLARCACDTDGGDELAEVAELLDAAAVCFAEDRTLAFRLLQIAGAMVLDA